MTKTQAVRVALIGLGTVGASLGLALGEAPTPVPLERVGHDPEPLRAQEARRQGAVDRVALTLAGAVEQADLVVLALSLEETRKTLAAMGEMLRPDAVVLDTCPARVQAATWAAEALPPARHYLGLVPVLNPTYVLNEPDAPSADRFRGAVMGVVATEHTPPEALRLAADFCALVGSTPLFLDAAEADGLLAAVEIFPQLLAAAYLQAAAETAGWTERRKFAGRAFARMTALEHPAADLTHMALAHRGALGRWLTQLGAQLRALGRWLETQDEDALQAWLEQAVQHRARWWRDRERNRWEPAEASPELPGLGETLARLVGWRRRKSS